MFAKILRYKHKASNSPTEVTSSPAVAMDSRSGTTILSEPSDVSGGTLAYNPAHIQAPGQGSEPIVSASDMVSSEGVILSEPDENNFLIETGSDAPIEDTTQLATYPQTGPDQHSHEKPVDLSPPLEGNSLYQGAVVKVLVGSSKTPFYLHKPVLCKQIPYFAALLNRTWSDRTETESVDLSFISVDGFRAAAHWAYSQRLPDGLAKYNKQSITDPAMLLTSIVAYKAADQLMISGLQNAIVDGILDSFLEYNLYFDFGDLAIVYENDLHHSPLFQLVLTGATMNFGRHNSSSTCNCRSKLDHIMEHPQVMKEVILLFATFEGKSQRDVKYGDRSEWYVGEIDHGRPVSTNPSGFY